jgi:GMP synthase (glutamine-hydrolysing)
VTAKILIADSAPSGSQAELAKHGAVAHGKNYAAALQSQAPEALGGLECFVLAVGDGERLPQGLALSDFHGIAWTGSPMSAFEDRPIVRHQIDFARAAFESGTPCFGSCWGLQVMTVALGGQVHRHPAGFEFGLARQITLNEAGRGHAMYLGKHAVFDALCSHQDEVCTLPPGAVALASNDHSQVQAAVCDDGTRSFWGVQYHPEYDLRQMAALFGRAAGRMVTDGFVRTRDDAEAMAADFCALQHDPARTDVAWRYGVGADVTDPARHRVEFANWLRVKVAPRAAAA